jgi:glyoxylase-like metal-dependent hydrolase (beta-lactamase superfamily II)
MTGVGNNTWFIEGSEPTLVDAGIGQADHLEEIERLLGGRPLARVLVTHGHIDHASGITAIRARWPDVDACKWPGGTDDPAAGWRALERDDRVRAGDRELTVLHTPGHAPDHICFWDSSSRDLFVGDMLVLGGTVMIPAGRGGDMTAYLASLDRLARLQPARALAGHGAIIDQPAALIAEYVAHRHAREQQIIDVMASGVATTDDIVSRVYPDLPWPLRPAATATVEAHLEKIRRDRARHT